MKILVAYDSTDGAERALDTATKIIGSNAGAVLLLRVLNPHADAADIVAPTAAEAMQILVQREQAAMDARLARLAPIEGVTATARIEVLERQEDSGAGIARIAEEWGADLIAIGSRRVAGLSGLLLGSVASRVLHLTATPVVLVKPVH